jgi:hypothetical protein
MMAMASPKCAVCQHRFARFYAPPDGSPPIGPWPRCRHCTNSGGHVETVASDVLGAVYEDISDAEIEARFAAALASIKAREKAKRMASPIITVSSPC